METCTYRKMMSTEKYRGKVASMAKKGYYGRRMAMLKAWKRLVKTMSLKCMICEFLCLGRIQKGWEMGQFSDFRASSEETEPKFRNLRNTLSKIGLTKNFHLVKSQSQRPKSQSQCWSQQGLTWQRSADTIQTGQTKYDTWRSLNEWCVADVC